jgi:hypothetical protein
MEVCGDTSGHASLENLQKSHLLVILVGIDGVEQSPPVVAHTLIEVVTKEPERSFDCTMKTGKGASLCTVY